MLLSWFPAGMIVHCCLDAFQCKCLMLLSYHPGANHDVCVMTADVKWESLHQFECFMLYDL